jgi:hypothetical protein
MKDVDLYGRVRHAAMIEGISKREAGRRFGIDPLRTLRNGQSKPATARSIVPPNTRPQRAPGDVQLLLKRFQRNELTEPKPTANVTRSINI